MSTEFDVTITERDLYKYQIRSAYTGTQGWISIIVGIVAIVLSVNTFIEGNAPRSYVAIYAILGLVILVYVPIALYLQSKRQYLANPVFSGNMHYALSDEGINLSAGGDEATLPWDMIYKVKATNEYLYIHTSRKIAYIVPMTCIDDKRNDIRKVFESKLEDYRLSIKKL